MIIKFVVWLLRQLSPEHLSRVMFSPYMNEWITVFVRNGYKHEYESYRTHIKLLNESVQNLEHKLKLREQAVSEAPTIQREVFTRMDAEVYDHFERTVQTNALVSSGTSEIEAGFKLGVMHVLSKLRAGYVVQRGN